MSFFTRAISFLSKKEFPFFKEQKQFRVSFFSFQAEFGIVSLAMIESPRDNWTWSGSIPSVGSHARIPKRVQFPEKRDEPAATDGG